jgi:hypothetical protein
MRKKNFFLKKGDIKFLSVKNVTIDLQKSIKPRIMLQSYMEINISLKGKQVTPIILMKKIFYITMVLPIQK